MITATANFHRAWTFLKQWECVYDHAGNVVCENVPGDGGGLTKYGVDQAEHPHVNIRDLTEDEAAQIYHDAEWTRCLCDQLPPNLALALFDFAVNSGMGTAAKKLQGVLGQQTDGWIGGKTIAAALATHDALSMLLRYKTVREAYYDEVADDHTRDRKFLKGWISRAQDLVTYVNLHPLSADSVSGGIGGAAGEQMPVAAPSNLLAIVAQLKGCGYECQAGSLENNAAFVELEKLAASAAA